MNRKQISKDKSGQRTYVFSLKHFVNCKGAKASILSLCILLASFFSVHAQQIDILLKGGHVIDPKNKIDSKMDVAIVAGKIFKVAANIPAGDAKKVVNVSGLYVTPGLIDLHVHVFVGTNGAEYMNGPSSVPPDGFTFRSGVTTVVDAGSSGWRSFPEFKKKIIYRSRTRVLAFLNIVGDGMGAHQQDIHDMDPNMAAQVARANKKDVVGFKSAHFGGNPFIPLDSAVKAGNMADMPVMLDLTYPSKPPISSVEELFAKHFRPGDIYTHMYRLTFPFYDNGKVKPFVWDAQKRGVFFDVGHGGNGFTFARAIPSIKQGFLPNSLSSDLHVGSMNGGMKDMANILSKFMAMGLSIQDVILRSTWNPAKEIKREELGNLSVGSDADVAVFSLRKGDFGYLDSHLFKLKGTQKLEAELTIRAGRIVWDLNGISAGLWNVAPGPENPGY
jgi:dihydroorotase